MITDADGNRYRSPGNSNSIPGQRSFSLVITIGIGVTLVATKRSVPSGGVVCSNVSGTVVSVTDRSPGEHRM